MDDKPDRDAADPGTPGEPELPLDLQQTQADGSEDIDLHISIAGYSNLQEIHRGGQGIVYRALQESTRRTVAIKVLREGAHAESAARKRFQREVEIVAQLDHPNIVSIFDSGVTSDRHPYFVMEHVNGVELDRYVRNKDLSVEETLRLYHTVVESVHYAHEKDVIHRDLKPSNILVDGSDQPKLVDFGLARPVEGARDSFASLTGQVLGTMAYMSPEQVRAKPDEIDARTDVYSLGVILYEILTGASPYPETTQIVEILHHITETSPKLPIRAWDSSTGVSRREARSRSISTKCPIDGDLETIVLKAMTKEPDRRYATAQTFADDLSRYLDGRPIEARRDSGMYILKKKLRRNRRVVMLYLAAIAVAGVGLFLALRPGTDPVAQLDPESIARYDAAEKNYLLVRSELVSILEARTAEGVPLDPLMQDSLRIIQDAIQELQTAIENDPGNRPLRELLLKSYQREIDLIKRVTAMPSTP